MTIVTSGSGLADIAGIVESTGKVSFTSGQGDVRLYETGLTTPRSVSVAIEDGAFADTTLRPGRGSVEFVFSTRRYGPYPIVVPESGTHTVASLITSAVLIPPDTAPELIIKAVEAYLEGNPIEGGGLSVEQIAAAAGDSATPLGQTLAERYAPKVETAVLTRDSSGRITSAVE
ncbi:hypothetical protein, partial [Rhodococcoides fascians]|uniref:hypothetical protein n=1 Tax=Rhodococcoides fascians TaxID=1828 RepID=UPI00050BE1D8